MLTEFCRVLTDFGSADQQLERPAEPAPPPRDNQIVNPTLGGCHIRRRNIAVPGHFSSDRQNVNLGSANRGLEANLSSRLRGG
jgi:hypothetical protein